MSEKLGVDKIEKAAVALSKVVIAGKKISEDKKVSLEDLPAAMGLIVELPSIIEAVSAWQEILAQGKDIDTAEIVQLIGKVDELVKAVEAA